MPFSMCFEINTLFFSGIKLTAFMFDYFVIIFDYIITHKRASTNTLFFIRTSKIGPFLFFKFAWFLCYIVLNLFLFSPDFFLIFHNTVMIYNARNRSNNTTESQKEKKTCFIAHAGRKWNLNIQCMQTNLKGVYSKNKVYILTIF